MDLSSQRSEGETEPQILTNSREGIRCYCILDAESFNNSYMNPLLVFSSSKFPLTESDVSSVFSVSADTKSVPAIIPIPL